ncbi:MAG: hypothetical protein QM778_00550 [Myxococcales bacterium]
MDSQRLHAIIHFPMLPDDTSFFKEETASFAIDGDKSYVRLGFLLAAIEPEDKNVKPILDAEGKVDIAAASKIKFQITGYSLLEQLKSYNGTHLFTYDRHSDDRPDDLLVYSLEHAIKNAKEQDFYVKGHCAPNWRHNYWQEAGIRVPTNEFEYAQPRIESLVLNRVSQPGAKATHGMGSVDDASCHTITVSSLDSKACVLSRSGVEFCNSTTRRV